MNHSQESENNPIEEKVRVLVAQSDTKEQRQDPDLLPRSLEMQKNLKTDYEKALRDMCLNSGLVCVDPRIEVKMTDRPTKYDSGYDPDTSSSFSIEASIDQKDGPWVTFLSRSVFFDKKSKEWKVVRHGIQVYAELGGKGIGSFLAKAEDALSRKEGIAEIYMVAGLTVGMYFNAQQGFDFATPELKSSANAKLLSFLIAKAIDEVRMVDSPDNLWPFKRSFTAQEMTKMRAYKSGKEIMVTTDRIKEESSPEESESIASNFFSLCCPEGTSEELKKFLKRDRFNLFALGQLSVGSTSDQRRERILQMTATDLENKNIQARVLEELGEEGSKEYNRLIAGKSFQEGFVLGLEDLLNGKISGADGQSLSVFRQELFPLGKAFFLDQGLKANFPQGWSGKKRL